MVNEYNNDFFFKKKINYVKEGRLEVLLPLPLRPIDKRETMDRFDLELLAEGVAGAAAKSRYSRRRMGKNSPANNMKKTKYWLSVALIARTRIKTAMTMSPNMGGPMRKQICERSAPDSSVSRTDENSLRGAKKKENARRQERTTR